jgi:hypothetical protein
LPVKQFSATMALAGVLHASARALTGIRNEIEATARNNNTPGLRVRFRMMFSP